jgi:exodeoxyribonuclease V gamma subunit
MAGLRLYTGNRLEILAGRLAERISHPFPSPLHSEVIVVQSRGMQRWLSMELARHHGICANIRFPFPNAFLDEIFSAVVPEYEKPADDDPEVMAWRIMALLPSQSQNRAFENIRSYLKDDHEDIKLYQLSRRIANLFDQYLIFRPDTILAWEAGQTGHDDELWQAELWRQLLKADKRPHTASLRRIFLERMDSSFPAATGLPERISLFGISWLPHFHTEVFYEISKQIDVNLYLMNPCREFWTDIRSDREMGRAIEKIREATGGKILSEDALHLEKGNSLLASLGTQGRDFFRVIADLPGEEWAVFAEPGEETLLQAIQSDILNLRERARDGLDKTPISPTDESIQIHSCHSHMREVEALYDQILALFEEDPELLPRDILIMAPDIEAYAPLIQAVFETSPEAPGVKPDIPRIPFAVADRSLRKDSLVIDRFLDLLEFPGSRFEASSVLSLLDAPPVKKKFSLSEEDMERIRHWTMDTRIKWGVDEESRRQAGLPAFPENTWKDGLERLLLGYALPGNQERLFKGILPYDHIEGHDAQALGSFAEYIDRLSSQVAVLGQPRTLNEWGSLLMCLLEEFFLADEETEKDLQAIRQAVQSLMNIHDRTGFRERLSIGVIKLFLRQCFEKQGFGFGFISGGITCCAMLPMRSIPFKVICLLGMNHDAYPRRSGMLGFDLMASNPRPGDPSRRNDDRYLFLEALLSARQKLIISYVGQGMMDNSLIPPSVLIAELIDYIEAGFEMPGKRIAADHLKTTHRLQAFHPAYFRGDSKLFSYSKENCLAAGSLLESHHEIPPFMASSLSPPPESWKEIELADFIHFFRHPTRFFLGRRLALTLAMDDEILEDQETFDVKNLEKYNLEQHLVEKALAGQNLNALYPLFRASGRLPHGSVGACHYDGMVREATAFVDRVRPYLAGEPLLPMDVRQDIAGFQISGRIDHLYRSGLFHYRYTDLKARDYLRLWISHLLMNTLVKGADVRPGTLVGRDRAWRFAPVENAESVLAQWLNVYWTGLSTPLKFFPETSWRYAEQIITRGRSREEALRAAGRIWRLSGYGHAESDDRYYQRCFGNGDPLDDEFEQLSILLLAPIFRHMTEARVNPEGNHDSL